MKPLGAFILFAAMSVNVSAANAADVRPAMERPDGARYELRGPLSDRLNAVIRDWLIPAPAANPAMTAMFRDRDRQPPRELMPWSGEFGGKHLISGVQAHRLTRDTRLRDALKELVSEIVDAQGPDGYLGPFPKDARMASGKNWDLWGQYHVMLGLLLWYPETGDRQAWDTCRKCADYFCRYFLDEGHRVYDAGSFEMNESCIHVFTLLYQETKEPRYLQLCREIEKDWQRAPSGDYVRQALDGKAFWQTPMPRWESLGSLQAIGELYRITGEPKYRTASERLWWSIVEGDRHNTGGFSSGEKATGNPYDEGAIETCCTVAWMALTVDYLRMTGDPRAADELEVSTWNAAMGSLHPSARWATYNTPMDGVRKASAHEIVFQAAPGSPELNCCSVNAPRGLGCLSDWALMRTDRGLALNYYGPSALTADVPGAGTVTLDQQTDYPVGNRILLKVTPTKTSRFELKLRIPGWSERTAVLLNGTALEGVTAGTYLVLDREWKRGDEVEIVLDFALWAWPGEKQLAGRASLYRGPILLAYDPRFDTHAQDSLPTLDVSGDPEAVEAPKDSGPKPILLVRIPVPDGSSLTLCDFASAGAAGNRYVSWLPVRGLEPVPWSKENPLRRAPVR